MNARSFRYLLATLFISCGITTQVYGQNFQRFIETTDTIDKYMEAVRLFDKYLHSNLDSLKILGDELLYFSNRAKYRKGIFLSYHILGDYFVESAQEEYAIYLLQQAKVYYFARQDDNKMYQIYNSIGTAYHRLGDYKNAVQCYKTALLYDESLPERLSTKTAMLNMARALIKLKDYQEAKEIAESFKEWAFQRKKFGFVASAFAALGQIALENNKYDQAMIYFKKGQEYAQMQSNTEILATADTNMGIVYFLQGDLESSEQCFWNALQSRKQIKTITTLCDAYLNYGGILFEQGKINDAIHIYTTGQQLAKSNKKYVNEIELLEALQEAYHNQPKQLEIILEKLTVAHDNLEYLQQKLDEQDTLLDKEIALSTEVRTNASVPIVDNTKNYSTWKGIALGVLITLSIGFYFQRKRKENSYTDEY